MRQHSDTPKTFRRSGYSSTSKPIRTDPNGSEPFRTIFWTEPGPPLCSRNACASTSEPIRTVPNRSLEGAGPTPKLSECLCLHIRTDPNRSEPFSGFGSVRMWRHKHSEGLGVGQAPSREWFETVRNGSERFGSVRIGSDRFGCGAR